ncbi:nucleoside/nucleotide kinase family protein [Albidovulum sp.]|uniref:nucleoside/nucleotide kinase family protein n=1 Tax=Albidovulum sp. TaxID=1872424 RepID=UPI003D7E268E
MSTIEDRVAAIVARLPERAGARRLVALAGPPATGKSTIAEALRDALAARGANAVVVPMDGYHLDNRILSERGLLPRKGAPETFDARGFIAMIRRLKAGEETFVPVFDRTRDIAIAGAGLVPAAADTIIVEGNYLMFDEDPWRELALLWDAALFLDASEAVLRERLVQRWRHYGLSEDAALARAEENDLPNARRILAGRLGGAITV